MRLCLPPLEKERITILRHQDFPPKAADFARVAKYEFSIFSHLINAGHREDYEFTDIFLPLKAVVPVMMPISLLYFYLPLPRESGVKTQIFTLNLFF